VPKADLPVYLDEVADQMMATGVDSNQRLELAALAFKTVIEDFPDESKESGIRWWLEWRDRFEGRTPASNLRSRL